MPFSRAIEAELDDPFLASHTFDKVGQTTENRFFPLPASVSPQKQP